MKSFICFLMCVTLLTLTGCNTSIDGISELDDNNSVSVSEALSEYEEETSSFSESKVISTPEPSQQTEESKVEESGSLQSEHSIPIESSESAEQQADQTNDSTANKPIKDPFTGIEHMNTDEWKRVIEEIGPILDDLNKDDYGGYYLKGNTLYIYVVNKGKVKESLISSLPQDIMIEYIDTKYSYNTLIDVSNYLGSRRDDFGIYNVDFVIDYNYVGLTIISKNKTISKKLQNYLDTDPNGGCINITYWDEEIEIPLS